MAPTDQITIRRAVNGDESALRAIWTQHAPRIDAVVNRLVGDSDLAADVAQEVWIQIFRALPSCRGDSQFSTWAHRIAVNRTLNALRSLRRISKSEVDIDENTSIVEHDGERMMLAQTIDEAVQKLSPGARTVFVLHDVEGYTHEEIATELGITSGGSKSQLFQGAREASPAARAPRGRSNPGEGLPRRCRISLLNDSLRWLTTRRRRSKQRTSRRATPARTNSRPIGDLRGWPWNRALV
ncbi:MAG: sigma-70 family RNA polymerase sigma factor [Gemmatimonadetes bacterium]|nr:sigma-70 family RNA polymerase sigma factor [Gemmatimonadota bacterium]